LAKPGEVTQRKSDARIVGRPTMSELELKFQVPADVVASLRAELRRHRARSVRLVAHYYDTPDFALAQNGLSLRLRHEGRRWVQTLKAEGRSTVERLEHNVPLRSSAARPTLDPSRHDGTQAGSALRAALADARVPRLAVRFSMEVTRLVCELRLRDAIIEAAFDEGSIKAGARTAPICELELEHKSGEIKALFELAKAWSAFGGLWLNTISKATRGANLARGVAHGPATKAGKAELRAHMSGPQFLRAVLRSTLDQVLANASEIASGSTDEEHVHQLRVGLRRLRTALRELGSLDQHVDAGWEAPLAKVFSQLGEVRDSVTAARAVRPLLEEAHAPKLEWSGAVGVDPVATVRDPAFQAALIDLLGFALQDVDGDAPRQAHAQLLEHLRTRLGKLHKRVSAASKEFETLPIEEQHKTRKRLKRLRYLAEFAAPLFAPKAAKRYLEHLEPAQDALGKHIDIAVALARFRADAESDARALFAVGFLEAYLEKTARAARAALNEVAKARPFWKD
jgi:inorganic triphosphatase YgiF